MRSPILGIAAFMAIAALGACGSSNDTADGGNVATALVAFKGTECNVAAGSPLKAAYAATARPLMTADAGLYVNLTCISWDATGTSLKVDLVNFRGGCNDWKGGAAVAADNTLELYANHEAEEVEGQMMCGGSCCSGFHDWSYEVKGVDATKDCPTRIAVGLPCEGDDAKRYDTTLPLASKKTGVLCRYVQGIRHPSGPDANAALHAPCDVAPVEGEEGIRSCATGFVCTKMSDVEPFYDAICLKSCAADADCPLDGLLKCDGGLCKLAETW